MGIVCFLVKSLSLRLINDCGEDTESVAGHGERKKMGLFGAGPEWRERERAEFHVEE